MLRVTEVLSDYVDLSMVPPDVLQAAADRGTLVHDICAGILQGFFPPEIPEEAKGYVDSFLLFKDKYIREVIAVEAEVVHPQWRYVGHIDFGGYFHTISEAVVLDWKTPITKSRMDVKGRLAKIEAERQEALRPDKEKLLAYADAIETVKCPEVSKESQAIVSEAKKNLTKVANIIRKQTRDL